MCGAARREFVAVVEAEFGHDRLRGGVARIEEMGKVPLIGVYTAFLRQVRARTFGAEGWRLEEEVVARLRHASQRAERSDARPVLWSQVLRVTVKAAVAGIQATTSLFVVGQDASIGGARRIESQIGQGRYNEDYGREDDDRANKDGSTVHPE